MVKLWLIRHGETSWSLSGRHTGRTDIPLTRHGVEQASMLARRIARKSFSVVLTSPLARARETCGLAGHFAGAHIDADLAEWDYGLYEGRTREEIRREVPDWTIWAGPVPGGETLEQVGERVDRVLARVRGMSGDVALFAHGHVLRVLAARWLGMPPLDGRLLALGTASLSTLGHEQEQPVILSWNESYDLVEAP